MRSTFALIFFVLVSANLRAEAEDSIDAINLLELAEKITLNDGWERRRKKRLLEKNRTAEEIEEIMKAERKEITARNKLTLEGRVEYYFKKRGLKDEALKKMVKVESMFLKKITSMAGEDRLKNLKQMHLDYAAELVITFDFLIDLSEEDLSKIVGEWKYWMFKNPESQEMEIKLIVKDLFKDRYNVDFNQEEMEKIKDQVEENLKGQNVKEDSYDEVYKIEKNICSRLLDVQSSDYQERYNQLHVEEAKRFILANKILNENLTSEINEIALQWKDTFYFGKSERIALFIALRDEFHKKRVDDITQKWSEKLAAQKLSKQDCSLVLEREMAIQNKLLSMPKSEREAENERLHMKVAHELITGHHISLKRVYREKIVEHWKEWWYLVGDTQKKKLTELLDYWKENYLLEIEKTITEDLREKGIIADDLKNLVKTKLAIEKKLLSVKEECWDEKREVYYQEAALKMIFDSKLFFKCPRDFLDLAKQDWEKWFHLSRDQRQKALEKSRDDLEKVRIQQRLTRSAGMLEGLKKELEDSWEERGTDSKKIKIMRKEMDSIWNTATAMSYRIYQKDKGKICRLLSKFKFSRKDENIFMLVVKNYFKNQKSN